MSFDIIVRQEDGEPSTVKIHVDNDQVMLRDLQQDLCRAFEKPFPATMASLTVNGVLYDDFHQQPFRNDHPQGECVVEFEPTDNPLFYDIADRSGRLTLEQEMNPQARPPLPDLGLLPPFVV